MPHVLQIINAQQPLYPRIIARTETDKHPLQYEIPPLSAQDIPGVEVHYCNYSLLLTGLF